MADAKYLLKILSGPHQGAEVALEDEELLIGSSAECDLILSDTLVSAEHARVIITDAGLSVVPLDSAVYLDGQEVPKDESLPLDLFQFVSLGTTHFVIGPVDEEWPPLSAADVPDPKKLAVEVAKSTDASEEGEGSEPSEGEEAEEKPKPKAALVEEEEPATDMKPIIMGTAALVILLIIGMIGVFVMMAPEEKPVIRVNPAEKVEQELSRLKVRNGFSIEDRDGILFVEGWVKDNNKRNSLENALASVSNKVDLRVYSQEQIVLGVEDLIATKKLPITVESLEPGSIRFSGYIGNSADWNRLKNDIKEDVNGIKFMKDDVVTSRKLLDTARSIFDKHKLGRKIEVVPYSNFVLVKGFVTEVENKNLQKALSAFQAKIGNLVPIQNKVLVAKAEKMYVDLDIDSVVVGKQGVIVTKDGQRYYRGGVLPNGFIVQEISREGIVLKKGSQEIILNIGEEYDGE